MAKTAPEKLLNEIKDKLIVYLLSGQINPQSVLSPDFNIVGIERLLRIHFIITEQVIEFINSLPSRIRLVKVATKQSSFETRGRFRGKMNIPKTIKLRLERNINDESLYVVDQISRKYDTDENIILKELLTVITEIIDNELQSILNQEYKWVEGWNSEHYEKFKEVNKKNIYLRSFNNIPLKSSDRMINRVSKSRTRLYRDAALLLSQFKKLMSYSSNSEEAVKLLEKTFIQPEDDRLFELFWCIKIIEAFEKDCKIEFLIRERNQQLLAKWVDDNYNYELFHQAAGDYKFSEMLSNIQLPEDDGYLKRHAKTLLDNKKYSGQIFGSSENVFNSGIPDIFLVIKRKDDDTIIKVVIGEVKYSSDKSYSKEGLNELLNYMAFIKDNNDYYNTFDNIYTNENIKGILFIDKQNLKTNRYDRIKVLTKGDELSKEMILT